MFKITAFRKHFFLGCQSPLGNIDIVPTEAVEAIPDKEIARQKRHEAFAKAFKVILISLIVLVIIFLIVVFGLRAWFISQKKRNGAHKRQQKKKKFKIKIK